MTHRLDRKIFETIEPAWGPERERSARAAIADRAARRRTAGRMLAATAVVGVMAAGAAVLVKSRSGAVVAGRSPAGSTAAGIPNTGEPTETVAVTQLSPGTVLAPLPQRGGRGFVLRAGAARFSVPHDAARPFVVTAGDATIEDLGTTFTVRFLAADRLNIAVEEGRVRVRASGTDTEVSAGATLEVPVAPTAASAAKPPRLGQVAVPSWRPLAERGRYEEARSALRRAGPLAVRNETADLLLAADAARLSGHPAEAVPYLERVLGGHANDPRAGLAAFTLGRVLLDELGRPNEAADAFARARSFGGPLAEDALAREVEAASRAGDVTRSRDLAMLYRRLYPHGRRANAVSRFGGLD